MRSSCFWLAPVLSLLAMFAPPALGQTYTVPGNFSTIQAAINTAETGATIIVSPGTYNERISFRDRDITLRSSGGASVTTINGGNVDRTVRIENSNSRALVVDGFTITGGGMRIAGTNCAPTVRNCVFSNNDSTFDNVGKALVIAQARPLIENCQFTSNGGPNASFGGAVALIDFPLPNATFRNCTFTNNRVACCDPRGGAVFNTGIALFEDCTFTGNQATALGGAIHMRNDRASLTLRRCTFTNNSANGAGAIEDITDSTSSLIIEDCNFNTNRAINGSGGAIGFGNYASNNTGSRIIRRSTFTGNTSTGGANAIQVGGDATAIYTLEDNTFAANTPATASTACCNEGGAVQIIQRSTANITRCTFTNNQGGGSGGALAIRDTSVVTVADCAFTGNVGANEGGALRIVQNPRVTVLRSSFTSNRANSGGGVSAAVDATATVSIDQCTFTSCIAAASGAIDLRGGQFVVRNSRLTGNSANVFFASMSCTDAVSCSLEGCLIAGNSSATAGVVALERISGLTRVVNCTITGNTITNSNENGLRLVTPINAQIRNCIIWNNTSPFVSGTLAQITGSAAATASVQNCIIQYGFTGTGNTATDPLFVNPAAGDFRVLAGSPALDTGVNADVPAGLTTDLNGLPRIALTGASGTATVDRGAFEAQDCNANAVPDHQDISAGTVTDLNANGVPDTCDDTFVYNLTRNLSYSSIAAAVAAANPADDLLASTLQFASTSSILVNKPVSLRSPAGILQPIGGAIELATGSSLRAAAGQTITVRGTLRNQPGASVEVGAASLSVPAGGALTVRSNSVLTASTTGVSAIAGAARVENDASLSVSGGLNVSGTFTALDRSSVITDGPFTNTGTLTFTSNTLVAGAASLGGQSRLNNTTVIANSLAVPAGATLTAFGSVYAPLTNSGQIVAAGNLLLVGNFVNNPGARLTVRVGTTNLVGSLTDNGQIIGDFCCRSASGLWIEGDYTAGSAASLVLNSASAFLAVAGNLDLAIDSNTRFDMALAELRMAGSAVGQTLEAMSQDRGPAQLGLNRLLPGAFPVKTLRIGTGSLTTVVNTRNNTGAVPGTCEAVYADTLVLEPGSALGSVACPVYYRTLVNNGGTILTPATVRTISTCRADFDNSGTRSIDDIFIYLNAWFAGCTGQAGAPCNGLNTDVDNSGTRTIDDIFIFLNLWFAGCP